MSLHTDAETLDSCEDFVILDSLKNLNLYQSLKADDSRLSKIRTEEAETYWKFLQNPSVDVIDQDTNQRVTESINYLKNNDEVMSLFSDETTDFDLDPIEIHCEKYLKSELKDVDFGLHGYVDYLKIDNDKKVATICDLKTTGKTVADFRETVDFYNYWLQAAVYMKLVYDFLGDKADEYTLEFKFIVIDKYNQVYVFNVSNESISAWTNGLEGVINTAKFHYNSRNYSLPMDFLVNKVTL